jgi:phosphatidylglycerophosphatase A
MPDLVTKFVATGFGVGCVPVAPGTMGSVLGVFYAIGLMRAFPSVFLYWAIVVLMILSAVRITGRAAVVFGHKDPGCVVLDEIVALPVAMAGLEPGLVTVTLAFAWFRVFDIWKPAPVRQLQNLPGGWGIVLDDVVAGIYAAVASHLTFGIIQWLGY